MEACGKTTGNSNGPSPQNKGLKQFPSLLQTREREGDSTGAATQALLSFLKAAADASVTPVTLFNVHSTICVLVRAESPVNIVVKAAFVGLPLSILPILFITCSILKVVEQGGCSLDIGSVLVLSQFIYIYILGGVVISVMFPVSKIIVASITTVLICIVIKMWGCLYNHLKCSMDVNSDHVDLKKGLSTVSGQNIAKVAEGKIEMAPDHSTQANSIRNSLNICFVLYLVFYVGFMLVLAIVAQKWWHALLCIAVMSPIHIWGLYLTTYLRDGLLRVHTMGFSNSGDDLC